MSLKKLKYYAKKKLKVNLGILFFIAFNINAQNSIIGDGFGGRLWYSPTNYSVGSYSGYSVCGDSNQLFGWGDNSKGQLGNGNKTSTILAVKAIGMTNVKFYTCGYYIAVIKKDNTGWVWGSEFGSKPIKVIDNIKFVDAGEYNVTFVKNDGTVWSLGNNLNNEFGLENEKIIFSKIPVKMQIFNRWEEKIHEANGREVDWNGTYKNSICQESVYLYVISVEGINGKKYYFRGTLSLLK